MKIIKLLGIWIACFIGLVSQTIGQDTLQVGYTNAPPFIIDSEPPIGVNIWLWEKIAQDLDIPYEFVKLPFSELMAAIEDGTIDVCINPLTLTAERAVNMHFTSPFYVSHSTVVVHTEHLSRVRNFIKTFFSLDLLTALLLLVAVIAIFGTLTWIFERKNNPEQFRNSIKGIWDGVWWSAVTMTTVGYGDKAPKSRGGKIIALLWMFTALLVVSGLTGSIASTILSSNKLSQSMTLDDLRSQKVGTIGNTGTMSFLKTALFRDVVAYSNVESGIQAIGAKEIDAFIYDQPILTYRLNELKDHHLSMLELKFDSQLYGFALSKSNSAWVPKMSERILHYTNTLEWPLVLSEYGLDAD